MTVDKHKPIGEVEFSKLMQSVGPFEKCPELAIGFSGGADSTGLLILASRWAKRRKGRTYALTVDHGLRATSLSEAKIAQNNIRILRVPMYILPWIGPKPDTRVQESARLVRYKLLSEWCRRRGVLHLLIAHHEEDQAETLLHRLGRKTGVDGLAGISAIRENRDVRILRPCLSIPKARLERSAKNHGIRWVEDPSNQNCNFARVRLRKLLPVLREEKISSGALGTTARHLAKVRNILDDQTTQVLARAAELNDLGYARIQSKILKEVDRELAIRALERLLGTIGGHFYPISHNGINNVMKKLQKQGLFTSRTLAGCKLQCDKNNILVIREAARCEEKKAKVGSWVHWDGRFRIRLSKCEKTESTSYIIKALGDNLTRRLIKLQGDQRYTDIKRPVRQSLPSVWDKGGLVCVPHLGYRRTEANPASVFMVQAQFQPRRSATNASFSIV